MKDYRLQIDSLERQYIRDRPGCGISAPVSVPSKPLVLPWEYWISDEIVNGKNQHRMRVSTLHLCIRFGACCGILVLVVRRLLFLHSPDFLPSKYWLPRSASAKLAGIVVNGATELVLQLLLLGLPIFLFIAARIDRTRRQLILNVAFSIALYIASGFLLGPPMR